MFCPSCPQKADCLGICQALEDTLPKDTTGRNHREISTSRGNLDQVYVFCALCLEIGGGLLDSDAVNQVLRRLGYDPPVERSPRGSGMTPHATTLRPAKRSVIMVDPPVAERRAFWDHDRLDHWGQDPWRGPEPAEEDNGHDPPAVAIGPSPRL